MRNLYEVLLRLSGGESGSSFDFFAFLFFIVFSVIYLIIPVLGYRVESRAKIGYSLYALIAYAVFSLVITILFWMGTANEQGLNFGIAPDGLQQNIMGVGRGSIEIQLLFIFVVLKMAMLPMAMIIFVLGLRSCQLNKGGQIRQDDAQRD